MQKLSFSLCWNNPGAVIGYSDMPFVLFWGENGLVKSWQWDETLGRGAKYHERGLMSVNRVQHEWVEMRRTHCRNDWGTVDWWLTQVHLFDSMFVVWSAMSCCCDACCVSMIRSCTECPVFASLCVLTTLALVIECIIFNKFWSKKKRMWTCDEQRKAWE